MIRERKKALVEAVGEYLGIDPIYQNAPAFAYIIGEYSVSKVEMMSGRLI